MTDLERSITNKMTAFLKSRGWSFSPNNESGTGEDWWHFSRNGKISGVLIIEGNGRDIISDWTKSIDSDISDFLDLVEKVIK